MAHPSQQQDPFLLDREETRHSHHYCTPVVYCRTRALLLKGCSIRADMSLKIVQFPAKQQEDNTYEVCRRTAVFVAKQMVHSTIHHDNQTPTLSTA